MQQPLKEKEKKQIYLKSLKNESGEGEEYQGGL